MNRNENLFRKLWQIIYPGQRASGEMMDAEMRGAVERMYNIVRQGEPDYEELWKGICGRVAPQRNIGWRRVWMYAAVIVLPLLAGTMGWLLMRQEGEREAIAVAAMPVVPQTGRGVLLTLSSGDVVEVREMRERDMRERVVEIRQDSSAGLVYKQQSAEDSVIRYNMLEVPVAADYKLQLADGTVVYMNSGSKLKYPVLFGKNERRVYLEGEAYFEVAKDAKKPFLVEVRDMEVEVLGTCFNINAYKERKEIQTTLAEGRVRVSGNGEQVVLRPGEQSGYSIDGMNVRKVNVKEFVSWKDGMFFFNRMSLEDIMMQMERWYDLNVMFFGDEVRGYTFTGMIDKSLSAQEIFDIIEKTVNVHFQMNGNQVIITKV